MNQYDPTFDLKINVGQCDLYFMVQWFCLTSWRLFDVWTSLFGIMNQYDLTFDRKIKCSSLWLLRIKVRLPVLLCAVKTVEGDFRFCWMISPKVGQTHKENPNLVRIFIWHLHWMIYTNSTTNYTKIDIEKSVHFAVPRTETRLKIHQTCIWNTVHMQSIAGPILASSVWTDEKKNKKKTKQKKKQKKNTELFL